MTRRLAERQERQAQLGYARELVDVGKRHPLPVAQEAGVLVGFAVGALLAHGKRPEEVQAIMMRAVDTSLCEAQLGGLIRKDG